MSQRAHLILSWVIVALWAGVIFFMSVHDELHAAIELVRQHAQLATAPTQLGKQGGDARVGLRQVVGIGAVWV